MVAFMLSYFMILQRYTYHYQVGLFRAYYYLAIGQREKIAFTSGSSTRETATAAHLSKRSVRNSSMQSSTTQQASGTSSVAAVASTKEDSKSNEESSSVSSSPVA